MAKGQEITYGEKVTLAAWWRCGVDVFKLFFLWFLSLFKHLFVERWSQPATIIASFFYIQTPEFLPGVVLEGEVFLQHIKQKMYSMIVKKLLCKVNIRFMHMLYFVVLLGLFCFLVCGILDFLFVLNLFSLVFTFSGCFGFMWCFKFFRRNAPAHCRQKGTPWRRSITNT